MMEKEMMSRKLFYIVLMTSMFNVGCQKPVSNTTRETEVATSSDQKTDRDLATQLSELSTADLKNLRELLDETSVSEPINEHLAEIAVKLRQLTLSDADALGTRLEALGATDSFQLALYPVQRQAAALESIQRVRERLAEQHSVEISVAGGVRFSDKKFLWLHKQTGSQVREVIGLSFACDPYDLGAEPTDVSNDDLKVLEDLTELQFLNLEQSQIRDSGLKNLLKLRNLEYLNLSNTRITDTGLRFVAELPSLTELKLEKTDIEGPGLGQLSKCQNLKKLNFTDESSVNVSSLSQIKSLTDLWVAIEGDFEVEDLPNLKELTVHLSDSTNHPKTFRLLGMPKLEVGMIYIRNPLDERFSIAKLPALKQLDLSGDFDRLPFDQLGDFTNLRVLYLGSRQEQTFTREEVQHISGLHQLEDLALRINLEPGCLQELQDLKLLRSLELRGNDVVQELSHLGNLPDLKILTIFGSQGAGQGFESLQQMPKLQTVLLRQCKFDSVRFTDLPTLSRLDIRESETRIFEVSSLPALAVLYFQGEADSLSFHDLPKLSSLGLNFHDSEKKRKISTGELPALTKPPVNVR